MSAPRQPRRPGRSAPRSRPDPRPGQRSPGSARPAGPGWPHAGRLPRSSRGSGQHGPLGAHPGQGLAVGTAGGHAWVRVGQRRRARNSPLDQRGKVCGEIVTDRSILPCCCASNKHEALALPRNHGGPVTPLRQCFIAFPARLRPGAQRGHAGSQIRVAAPEHLHGAAGPGARRGAQGKRRGLQKHVPPAYRPPLSATDSSALAQKGKGQPRKQFMLRSPRPKGRRGARGPLSPLRSSPRRAGQRGRSAPPGAGSRGRSEVALGARAAARPHTDAHTDTHGTHGHAHGHTLDTRTRTRTHAGHTDTHMGHTDTLMGHARTRGTHTSAHTGTHCARRRGGTRAHTHTRGLPGVRRAGRGVAVPLSVRVRVRTVHYATY